MLLELSVLLFGASQRNQVTFTCENGVCDIAEAERGSLFKLREGPGSMVWVSVS